MTDRRVSHRATAGACSPRHRPDGASPRSRSSATPKTWWTTSKLRASFGSLGNQNVSSYYTYMRLITNKDFSNYTFDGSIKGKYSSLGAPVASDLTWETAQQWDLGLISPC